MTCCASLGVELPRAGKAAFRREDYAQRNRQPVVRGYTGPCITTTMAKEFGRRGGFVEMFKKARRLKTSKPTSTPKSKGRVADTHLSLQL